MLLEEKLLEAVTLCFEKLIFFCSGADQFWRGEQKDRRLKISRNQVDPGVSRVQKTARGIRQRRRLTSPLTLPQDSVISPFAVKKVKLSRTL